LHSSPKILYFLLIKVFFLNKIVFFWNYKNIFKYFNLVKICIT